MKKAKITIFFIITCLYSFSQPQGFYHTFSDPEGKTWRVGDVIETENGFLFSLRDYYSSIMGSKIVSMSLEGEILGEVNLVATDTTINLMNIFPTFDEVGSFDCLAVRTTSEGDAMLLTLRIDGDLDKLGSSLSPLPSPDNADYWLDDYKLLQTTDGYFMLLRFMGQSAKNEIKLCKISNEGVVTQVERMQDSLATYVANVFHVHDNPNGVGIFLHKRQILGAHVNSCAMVYDGNLQLKKIYDIVNWCEDDGHGNIYSGDLSLYNSMMCPSHDGGYYISSRLEESTVTGTIMGHDRSSVLAKTDSAFQICPQYCIIGHLNDTVESPSFYKSVDVNGEGMVFQCSMQNLNYGSWPYGSNGTHLVVTKTDADLNVSWQKRFLKEGNIYSAFQTIATSDGGCLIVGNVYDHNSELIQDLFVLKINEDGMVGIDEIEEESVVFVYPNPANGLIRIGGVEARETQVFNGFGQYVMSFYGNEASVETLTAGIYLFRITDREGASWTVRLVRK